MDFQCYQALLYVEADGAHVFDYIDTNIQTGAFYPSRGATGNACTNKTTRETLKFGVPLRGGRGMVGYGGDMIHAFSMRWGSLMDEFYMLEATRARV